MIDTLASMSSSAHLVQMFDSTIVRAHVLAAGAKGSRIDDCHPPNYPPKPNPTNEANTLVGHSQICANRFVSGYFMQIGRLRGCFCERLNPTETLYAVL